MREEDLLHAETFRDRVSTVDDKGRRKWVYASKPKGKWYNYRTYIAYVYLVLFFALPFIKLNGLPFIMINITEGRFIIFGNIFWPQDFFIFAVAMITFIVSIVLFTVIYGRLFCGWVCPQTIFMEFVFRPIEWLIDGSPGQQYSLHQSEWNGNKLIKRGLKHFIFFCISFIIANTFLAYILGIDEVFKIIREPISEHVGLLAGLIIFTFLFYVVYAFVRDLVCTTICPYGRLQSVMVDKDTVQIAYDYSRGEPRAKYKKNVERTEGDCISCNKCVHVCPTGIDIRNGVQMECVGCTACIDACNEVMDALHFKRGLIRYASENEIKSGQAFKFNTRVKAYTALLIGLMGLMVYLVFTRKSVDTYLSRVKGQLFQEVGTDTISNLFDLKVINKTRDEFPITLKIENMPGTYTVIGTDKVILKPESINDFTMFLKVPKSELKQRSNDMDIGVYKGDKRIQLITSKFLGPFK